MAGPALLAVTARNRRVHSHGRTGERSFVHDTADLVPEDERSSQQRVADSAVFEPMQVRAAYADIGDAYQRLVGTGDRRLFLVQAEIPRGMQPYRAH